MLVSNIRSDVTFENFQNFVITEETYETITSENFEYSLTNSLLGNTR